jgi:hypothetical protein
MRDNFYVVGEGILTFDEKGDPVVRTPSTIAELRKFRFSRLGPKGELVDESIRKALAEAMTAGPNQPDSSKPALPAGFTYLGQFVDHDVTMDRTAASLGENVTVAELVQGRSPALDLDCLYGRGPRHAEDAKFYSDGVRLKTGTTSKVPFPPDLPVVSQDLAGFDLPRVGHGSTKSERRAALIPDPRNDENLIVAQTHLAFIRFHNRVADKLAAEGTPSVLLFERARRWVVRHYQWMLRTDFLPRIVDPAIVDDVFRCGRRFFEPYPLPGFTPTMPVEFSVAAYRIGHSMVRGSYQWNRVFRRDGPGGPGTLELLFRFSGTSGILSPPPADLNDAEAGAFESLPTNWCADFRRLFDFSEAGRNDLTVAKEEFNLAKRIDPLLVDPLKTLPLGAFGARGGPTPPAHERNLAFRNLTRANMVKLASGQQMAETMCVEPLSAAEILNGSGGVVISGLSQAQKDALVANTPLWFYILREAELNGGRMTGVGGRIVAEVFHRAMEGSATSILHNPFWRPRLGPDANTFRMVDLLLFAYEGKAELLNPLGG